MSKLAYKFVSNCGNSLFYDPFAGKIYDYANGMADLRSMKVTLFDLLMNV